MVSKVHDPESQASDTEAAMNQNFCMKKAVWCKAYDPESQAFDTEAAMNQNLCVKIAAKRKMKLNDLSREATGSKKEEKPASSYIILYHLIPSPFLSLCLSFCLFIFLSFLVCFFVSFSVCLPSWIISRVHATL